MFYVSSDVQLKAYIVVYLYVLTGAAVYKAKISLIWTVIESFEYANAAIVGSIFTNLGGWMRIKVFVAVDKSSAVHVIKISNVLYPHNEGK